MPKKEDVDVPFKKPRRNLKLNIGVPTPIPDSSKIEENKPLPNIHINDES